ncbi:MAG TPA: flavodoxin domain-containing protein [Candidatus Saccharimonadales bacterium]|nr:flavodoxin domain-containing protein [Candidatus Saccharimonadales bacterium]
MSNPVKVIIIYASNSGSTYLTSQIIRDILLEQNLSVDLKKAVNTKPDEVSNYDVVLLGSPSWKVNGEEGSPHEYLLSFMADCKNDQFANKKVAAFGCGDSSYLFFCVAADVLDAFCQKVGGNKIQDPLKVDSFYFDLDNNVEKVKAWANKLAQMLVENKVSSLV